MMKKLFNNYTARWLECLYVLLAGGEIPAMC